MATTIATISLASSDLTSSALAFSSSNPLNTAGTATGLSLTSGLSRTNFTDDPIHQKLIYRGDDATANGANKIYMKNLSTTPAEYFTLYINSEEMGRLYAGDWLFIPWSQTDVAAEIVIEAPVDGSVCDYEYAVLKEPETLVAHS